MKKTTLLLAALFMLFGCNAGADRSTDNEVPDVKITKTKNGEEIGKVDEDESAADINEEEKEAKEEVNEEVDLTEVEAKEIVLDHFMNRLIEMDKLMERKWEEVGYDKLFDRTSEEYKILEKEVGEVFEPLVTKALVNDYAEAYADIYTCECDAFSLITPEKINVKFELVEQSANQFIASFIELGDEMDPEFSGMHFTTFVMEDGQWKLLVGDFEPYDGKSYELTPEDLLYSSWDYEKNKVRKLYYIETRNVDGKEVIVVRNKGSDYEMMYDADSGMLVYK